MKKLLSLLMAVVMVASMIVPMTVSAGGVEESEYGNLLYEENFNDTAKAEIWKSQLTGDPDIQTNEDSAFQINDGKLIFSDWTGTTAVAPRFTLFQVPSGATEFTAIMKFSTTINESGDDYS